MGVSVRLADLALLSAEDQARALAKVVNAARSPNGGGTALTARIRAYEIRYEISSEELLEDLRLERRKETADIAEWLFLLEARGDAVYG